MLMLQLEWLHVSPSDRSYTRSLDDGVAYYSLAFGISTEQLLLLEGRNQTTTTSSGITWADCVYVADTGAHISVDDVLPAALPFHPLVLQSFHRVAKLNVQTPRQTLCSVT